MLLGCEAAALPAMVADAALTRHPGAPRAAAVVTTGGLLAAWVLAVALNPLRLGFLVVVGPMLAAFGAVFAVLAAVTRHRTGGQAVPVMLRTLTFGWILSVAFPLLG
jgi:membrane associated rhomboid family serine protease